MGRISEGVAGEPTPEAEPAQPSVDVEIEYEPEIDPLDRDLEDEEYAGRGTFHDRRSAGLPKIGASAATAALAAVTATRMSIIGENRKGGVLPADLSSRSV